MVTENNDGTFTFRVYDPHATSVEIVGDFTAGGPGLAMDREEDGWWCATVRLPAGDHTFRYLVNGHCAMPDYAAGGLARDGEGNWVSCLHVPPQPPGDVGHEHTTNNTGSGERISISADDLRTLRAGGRIEIAVGEERFVVVSLTPGTERTPGRSTAPVRPERGTERRRATRDDRRGRTSLPT